MARIAVNIILEPGEAEVMVSLKRPDGSLERFPATIDTGAQMCLFPMVLLGNVVHRITEQDRFVIEQAGIAGMEFSAVEAVVELIIEDSLGNQSIPLNVSAWFADTEHSLLGFRDFLDRATLYLDMRQTRTGWMEFND